MALHLAESHITQWQGPLGMRNAFSPPRVKKREKKEKRCIRFEDHKSIKIACYWKMLIGKRMIMDNLSWSIHVSYTGKVTDEFNDFATNAATSAGKSIIAIFEKLLLKTYARSFRWTLFFFLIKLFIFPWYKIVEEEKTRHSYAL